MLQRVDLTLDRRLREEIATVVLEQTSACCRCCATRLETVVRETVVAEAVADEMQARQRAGGRERFSGAQRGCRVPDDLDLTLWFGRGNCDNVAAR